MSVPHPEPDGPPRDPDQVPASDVPEAPAQGEPEARPPGADEGIEEAEQQPEAQL